MWTGRFKKQYRNLDSNTQQGGVEAIREIMSSVNPASLGTYKPNMGVFAYEIGRKYRIIYSIQYRTESWICFGHVIACPQRQGVMNRNRRAYTSAVYLPTGRLLVLRHVRRCTRGVQRMAAGQGVSCKERQR